MKILWIDLNSSYAHASLALPAIHAQIKGNPDCTAPQKLDTKLLGCFL